jgi:hypothetical protein
MDGNKHFKPFQTALTQFRSQGVGTGSGFAALSSSLGHNSTRLEGVWAYNAPEKVANWGYRALHGSIVLGKELTHSTTEKIFRTAIIAAVPLAGAKVLKRLKCSQMTLMAS